jgi:chromosome segregation ATPase
MTTEHEPLGLVERVRMIAATVDAVCGHTDDPEIAAMRAVTFCLTLNFHMTAEVDQAERALYLVRQVRDISDCADSELPLVVALFSIRAQDILQEEIDRIQGERQIEIDEATHLGSCVDELEAQIQTITDDRMDDIAAHGIERARLHGALGQLTDTNKRLLRRDQRRRSELNNLVAALRDRNATIAEQRRQLQEQAVGLREESRLAEGYARALENFLVGLEARSRQHVQWGDTRAHEEVEIVTDTVRGILTNPTAALGPLSDD